MKILIALLFTLFISTFALGQNSDEQLEFKIENDKLVLDDRYYTSGLFITYRRDLKGNFIFNKNDNDKLQLNLGIGNETYTPTNLNSTNPQDFDRPYAGWFFVSFELGKIKQNSALFFGLESGITGEESLSGKIQTRAHKFFKIDEPTWTQEIDFKFLVNLKAKYILNKRLGKMHAIKNVLESSLGTKDIFISNKVEYVIGRINNFNQSSRANFIDNTNNKEFFGFIGLGYKYVAHNTLIQGSLDFNDTTFTTDRVPHIFEFRFGSTLKFKSATLKLIYNFNTKETPLSSSHSYGTFSFGQSF